MKSRRKCYLAHIFSISKDANGGMKFKSTTVGSQKKKKWVHFFDVLDYLSLTYSEALECGAQCTVTVYSAGDMAAGTNQVDLTTVQFRVGEVEPETKLATEQAESATPERESATSYEDDEPVSTGEDTEAAQDEEGTHLVSHCLSLPHSLSLSLFSRMWSLSLPLSLSLFPLSLSCVCCLAYVCFLASLSLSFSVYVCIYIRTHTHTHTQHRLLKMKGTRPLEKSLPPRKRTPRRLQSQMELIWTRTPRRLKCTRPLK